MPASANRRSRPCCRVRLSGDCVMRLIRGTAGDTSTSFDPIAAALMLTKSVSVNHPPSIEVRDVGPIRPSHDTSVSTILPDSQQLMYPKMLIVQPLHGGSTSPEAIRAHSASSQRAVNRTSPNVEETVVKPKLSRTPGKVSHEKAITFTIEQQERLNERSRAAESAPAKGTTENLPTFGNSPHPPVAECASPPGPVVQPARPLWYNQVAFFVNSSPDGRR